LLWKVEGIGTGWSSPIIVGEMVYVTGDIGADLVICAYDRDGHLRWKTTNGAAWTGSYPGSRACCVYSAGRLYHLNAHGRLAALRASTGEELWTRNILEEFEAENITWGLSECLLIDGTQLIVTPGGKIAFMAALDCAEGRTLWTTQGLPEEQATYSSPILFQHAGRRLIANCSSSHGCVVDAKSGDLLCKVPLKNDFGVNASTPIYGQARIYFVTPYGEQGRAYRLSATDKGVETRLAWHSSLDTVTGAGVLIDGTLYSAGYRQSKWWFGIDWNTGVVRDQSKELTTGAAIWAENRLYCFDEQGRVGLIRTDQPRMEVVGSFPLLSGRIRDAWAHPVLQDGRLYLRYHDTLYCFDVTRQ
jgi:outer membrane protein assembly factor BamB